MSRYTVDPKKVRLRFPPRLRFHVEQHHIDEGESSHSGTCAVALAIKEAFPWATSVQVTKTDVRISYPKLRERYYYTSPPIVAFFVNNTEEGIHCEPATIRLRAGLTAPMGQNNRPSKPVFSKSGNNGELPSRKGGKPPKKIGSHLRIFGQSVQPWIKLASKKQAEALKKRALQLQELADAMLLKHESEEA